VENKKKVAFKKTTTCYESNITIRDFPSAIRNIQLVIQFNFSVQSHNVTVFFYRSFVDSLSQLSNNSQ